MLTVDDAPAGTARRIAAGATHDARAEAAERRQLERDLRNAARQDGFVLHYQPQTSLASGRMAGVEALLRWPHRRRGMVPPGSFIPLAERSGLITEIGGWVLRTACREAVGWPDETILLSVNVSARQIQDQALLGQVAAALDASGLSPERLELELTESMLIDINIDLLLGLAALRDLGIGLALDDFGTGYASLAMLRQLPLSTLKLDRSLVRGLPGNAEDAAIVRAVVETGHVLGLHVIAEGIETEAQRAFLAGIGCDAGQGHLFSRPLPLAQLRTLLAGAAGQ
jgi:EAL domain-containing protein (putative c-di-GMP-specific phosphodiesterase class I)